MPTKVYINPETVIEWTQGGSPSFATNSLAAGAGMAGAFHDFGVIDTARPMQHNWRAVGKPNAAAAVNGVIRVYWRSSDGTYPDGPDITPGSAITDENFISNLKFLGSIVIESNTIKEFVKSGGLDVIHRYGAPVFWNATNQPLSGDAVSRFLLGPVPPESQ